jgi:acetyl-CoA carboxylase biotin carboxylase subunit
MKDMFKKIMIANRGEIALRVICACQDLGIKTVAVYSDADRQSLHVKFADEAFCIGPARSTESYLNVRAVLSAAQLAGVDAIHPGYGFLSEDADFAEACENCKIRFIGPAPAVVRLMGEKEKAREVMRKANVPVLPGSDGVLASVNTALQIAEAISYPIILKASCGGGGRGMRIVRSASEMERSFQAAQSEAARSFGNGNLYMEKLLERPRHIEFQILGDAYGDVVSLGERECSIQRRHQKLLEESPSPALTEELRRNISQKVETCLSSIGYENAGTVEFLMDEGGALYFIEMNPRIQVEHAVTEMVTGVDLVKAQIALAGGAKLQSVVPRVERRGHAIECRINAEHPETFRPSAGKIKGFHAPGGPGIRVDTAAHAEAAISPHYDSLIAKVVAHGTDRDEAICRMRRALGMLIVDGIDSTISLHRRILEDSEFKAGQIDTKYIERLLCGRDGPRALPPTPLLHDGGTLGVA